MLPNARRVVRVGRLKVAIGPSSRNRNAANRTKSARNINKGIEVRNDEATAVVNTLDDQDQMVLQVPGSSSSLDHKHWNVNAYQTDVEVELLSSRQINHRITSVFKKYKKTEILKVKIKDFVGEYLSLFDHIHVMTLLHRCAKHRILVEDVVTWKSLILQLENSTAVFDGYSIGMALYSLRLYSDASPEYDNILQFLQVVHSKIKIAMKEHKSMNSRKLTLNNQSIGSALYGLHGIPISISAGNTAGTAGNTNTVSELLTTLAIIISPDSNTIDNDNAIDSDQALSGQELSNALYGLQNKDSALPCVDSLLSAVVARSTNSTKTGLDATDVDVDVEQEQIYLSSQNIGMALLGLRGKDTKVDSVRNALSMVCDRMESAYFSTGNSSKSSKSTLIHIHRKLDNQGIANAMLGIAGMNTDCVVVKRFLCILAQSIEGSTSISSISSISTDENEKNEEQEQECDNLMTGQEIGNSFYGLHSMDASDQSSMKEANRLLLGLINKAECVVKATEELSVSVDVDQQDQRDLDLLSLQSLCSAIYGLKNTRNCHSLERALNALSSLSSSSSTQKQRQRLVVQGSKEQEQEVELSGSCLVQLVTGLRKMQGQGNTHTFNTGTKPTPTQRILQDLTPYVFSPNPTSTCLHSPLTGRELALVLSNIRTWDFTLPYVRNFLSALLNRASLGLPRPLPLLISQPVNDEPKLRSQSSQSSQSSVSVSSQSSQDSYYVSMRQFVDGLFAFQGGGKEIFSDPLAQRLLASLLSRAQAQKDTEAIFNSNSNSASAKNTNTNTNTIKAEEVDYVSRSTRAALKYLDPQTLEVRAILATLTKLFQVSVSLDKAKALLPLLLGFFLLQDQLNLNIGVVTDLVA